MSNQAKVKKNQWASDDAADDLLADIFSDTATAAAMEEQRLEADIKRREQEEELKRQQEEQRRLQEAESKLKEEESRQQQLEQRRTARMEAIKVEDLKARGEWVDPAIEEAKKKAEEERRIREEATRQAEIMTAQKIAEQQARTPEPMPNPAAAQPVAPKSKAPMIALAAVLIAVIGAGGVIAALTLGSYKIDQTAYAKVTLEPKEAKDLLAVKSFNPLPKEEPLAAVAPSDDDSSKKKSSGRRKTKSRPSAKTKTKPAGKKKGLKLDLGGDSVFGGGF